jgi:hypothetical protein
MFIDTRITPTTRAPAERNVRRDEDARSSTFRSSGARTIFLNSCSINISSLRDEELCRTSTSAQISSGKQELARLFHWRPAGPAPIVTHLRRSGELIRFYHALTGMAIY